MRKKTAFVLMAYFFLSGCISSPTLPANIGIFIPDCSRLVPQKGSIVSISGNNIPSDMKIDWQVDQGEIRSSDPSNNTMMTYIPAVPGNATIQLTVTLLNGRAYHSKTTCLVQGAAVTTTDTPASVSPVVPITSASIQPQPSETATFMPSVTAQVVVTSTPESPILFSESFLNNQQGWVEQSEPQIVSRVSEGKYTHIIDCQETSNEYCQFDFIVPNIKVKDFKFEIDTKITQSQKSNVGIELRFRQSETRSYGIAFYNSGFYNLLFYRKNRSPMIIKGATDAPDMNRGDSASNRLGIVARDNVFQPIINGQLLAPITDANALDAGSISVVLWVEKGKNVTIDLSNLMITKP